MWEKGLRYFVSFRVHHTIQKESKIYCVTFRGSRTIHDILGVSITLLICWLNLVSSILYPLGHLVSHILHPPGHLVFCMMYPPAVCKIENYSL